MAEKIGVYFDEASLGGFLDLQKLAEVITNKFASLTPVVKSHQRLASDDGVAMVKADIEAEGLDAVCICGPTPRVDWDVFQFPGVLVDRVNLREQCVLGYKNPDGSVPAKGEATPQLMQVMAEDYVKMGVTKLSKMKAPSPELPETTKNVLVLGGGWSGLTAALNVAKAGVEVILVEKAEELGGKALGLAKSFPMSHPYREMQDTGIKQKVAAVNASGKITVHTKTTLKALAGAPGLYEATLKGPGGEETINVGAVILATGWEPLDNDFLKPLGYGTIANVVTSKEYEAMVAKGAIARPSDGAKPMTVAFAVDVDLCTKQAWGTLEDKLAEPEATEDDAKDQPAAAGEEGEEEKFVFEPMDSCKHLAYSSELNSLVALKHANYLLDAEAGAMAYVFYNHMMVPGINELYYKAAQDRAGVMMTKGSIVSVREDTDKGVLVTLKDTLLGELVEFKVDMFVVPTGMVPTTALSPIINLQYRQGPALPDLTLFDGFADSNYICFPYETRRTGIYAAGCVRQPMSMAMAEDDATGAALKAIQCLASINRGMAVHPRSGDTSYPIFNFVRCTQCKRCTEECPFGALDDDPKGTPMPNPTRCRRCGTCMGACPERVISFDTYNVDQIGSMIKQVTVPPKIEEGGPRAIVLACENDAYPAIDMAAMRGHRWSPYVRFVSVRCLGSVNTIWIADAMGKGVDGVLLLGCKFGDDYQCHFMKGSELCNRRMENVAETLKRLGVEPERVKQEQVAIDEYDRVPELIDNFMNYILKIGPNPFKGY